MRLGRRTTAAPVVSASRDNPRVLYRERKPDSFCKSFELVFDSNTRMGSGVSSPGAEDSSEEAGGIFFNASTSIFARGEAFQVPSLMAPNIADQLHVPFAPLQEVRPPKRIS